MKTKPILLLVACVCWTEAQGASPKTASASATCLSLGSPNGSPYSRYVNGFGTVTTYGTTYDGASGTPLHDVLPDGTLIFSYELRPRDGVPGLYESDYVTLSSIYGFIDYGSVFVSLPTADTDENGIPDFRQYDRSASYSWTGMIVSYSGTVYTSSGTGSKLANSSSIHDVQNIFKNGTNVDSFTSTGPFLYAAGTISYSRGTQNSLSLNLALDTLPYSYTGSTTFTVNTADLITVPQFTFQRSDGRSLTVYGITLTRTGTKYVGRFSIDDGNTSTSWRDYTSWVLEISDANDYDGNGIPDLSDALPTPPVITQQPNSMDAPLGGGAVFLTASTTREPNTYQWFFKNRPVQGGNSAVLMLTNLRLTATGTYFLEVRNTLGAVRSQAVTLRVLRPARILNQPRGRSVASGKTLTLRTLASGSKPLFFQWLKDGQIIPGATLPKLVIPNATGTNAGTYSVTVSNSVSSAVSSPAVVVVN